MAVPTYDELLAHYNVEIFIMKQTFDDEHLRELSIILDMFEILARKYQPSIATASIKIQCTIEKRCYLLRYVFTIVGYCEHMIKDM
jgi:hypothetical protein